MENKKTTEYTIVIISVVALFILAWEFTHRDARFGRLVLDGLVRGSVKVEKLIDWEQLKATGIDVGANYRRLSTLPDKETYRRLFIRNFAVAFQQGKGDFKKFTNWRVLQRKPTKVVVGADYLLYNKTILFTLSKSPRTKLIAIEWKE